MNRTWKSVLSVLLAVALLLPMAPAVRAVEDDGGAAEADEAIVTAEAGANYATETNVTTPTNTNTSLTLTASRSTIYYRDPSHPGEITVTASGFPEGSSKANWKVLGDDDGLLRLATAADVADTTTDVIGGTTQLRVRATKIPGLTERKVELTVTAEGGASGSIPLSVVWDTINTSTIRFEKEAVSVQAGDTVDVKLTPEPVYPSGDKPKLRYASSNTNAATVDPDSGRVAGVKAGMGLAVISVYLDDNLLEHSKVTVSVLTPSTEVTGSATRSANFSMQPIYTQLVSAFSKSYPGNTPSTISFTSLNTVNGTLYVSAGVPAVGKISNQGNPYEISKLSTMFLAPSNDGTFQCEAEVSDTNGNVLTATIKITISLPSYTVRVPISGGANYSFSKASADVSGKTGAQLIREKIGVFGSIQFGAIPSASSNVGTLYTASKPSNDNLVWPYGNTVVPAAAIDELYFIPTRQGTYTIPFTAWSGDVANGNRICTGTLVIPVDSTSLDISVTLNRVAPYTFSESLGSSGSSVYFQMIGAINNSVGASSWAGIRFDGAASASSTGTLRQSSSYSYAIAASTYIEKAQISSLYYVPERTGTYEITYGVYESVSSATPVVTGKLIIKTSTMPAGSADISYPTSVKNTITLSEDDFINFFQKKYSKYELSFVVFNEYDGGGTFYHSASSFLPYNSADFYTSTYTGSMPSNARYLKNLSFTAPSAAGYTAVRFTCYGGSTTSSTTTSVEGKLCIYYTADDVPAVSYNAFSVASVDLKEGDFAVAYNAAMKSSVSAPSFTVQLLNPPSSGTLYYYYSGNNRTAITSNNIAAYTFSINDKSGISIEQLTYVPNRSSSGTDKVTYLATSASGTVLYVGTIQFKLSPDLTMNVTNDGGANFRLTDFYSASDSDPILYVTFPQPSAGKVYVYAGGRYVAATEGTKLYTVSASDGQYPLTSAFYAPKASETGTVSLRYVAHRKSGATSDNLITMNVQNKVSSGIFGDVGGVFSWAASSIDFASRLGLVNGTNTSVNPPLFSPDNTMRRSDFVLMLYRHAGSPAVSGSTTFTDVPAGKYYYNSAVWAERNNIMRNVTVNGLYNPEGALTRQDFAQILFNFTTYMGVSTANNGSLRSYSDASSVSLNTLEGVTWAVAKGYITSAVVGAMYIEPTREAKRSEISTLLHRYLTY